MKRIVILVLAFIVSINVQAQTSTRKELVGARHVSPGVIESSSATFAVGMSLDGDAMFVESARLGDTVAISGVVRPEAGHVGQTGDIFIVERSDQNTFTMRIPDGSYIAWNGIVSALVPFLNDAILTPEMTVDIFSGQLGLAGGKRLFLGYIPSDGKLRYTPTAAHVEVTAQSARDEAMVMFATSISNDIVHTNCIACHISGGLADGLALHKFVATSNSNHLTINFSQFEILINKRGRSFVLEKVVNPTHPGGGIILPGSVAYQNLDRFLRLLENL